MSTPLDVERLAREALKAWGLPMPEDEPWPKKDYNARKWEKVAAAVAALVLEEAARVCEARWLPRPEGCDFEAEEADACAAAIRALKPKEQP
jgi:hypothetical protein